MTKDIYIDTCISKEQNDALLKDHSNLFVLTPEDIITLKLGREILRRFDNPYRTNEYRRLIETLERILKQVQ